MIAKRVPPSDWGLSEVDQQSVYDLWRYGVNAAPGIDAHAPNGTPLLLANLPLTPDANWIYIVPSRTSLSWSNVTLPGHIFYPGTVVNSVETDQSGITWLVSRGEGTTPNAWLNETLGSAFFLLAQADAVLRYRGFAGLGRIGSKGTCNAPGL